MTWRQVVVVRILFLVVRIVAGSDIDPVAAAEIKAIAQHVNVYGAKADER